MCVWRLHKPDGGKHVEDLHKARRQRVLQYLSAVCMIPLDVTFVSTSFPPLSHTFKIDVVYKSLEETV